LNLQFFTLFFIPLIGILLLISIGSLTLHQRAMRQLVGERDERAARTAASAIGEQIYHRSAAVRGIALRASDQISPEEILNTSDFLLGDFDFGLALFSHQGELLANNPITPFWNTSIEELASIIDRARENAGKEPVYSPPFQDQSLDESIVFVAYCENSESPIAVGAFSPVMIARRTLAGAFTPGEGSAAFVASRDYQVIYQIGELPVSEGAANHPGIAEALRGESGTTYIQIMDSEHVIAFSPIQPTGWALVIEEPWESVTNPLLNTTQLAPLILVPVLLLALVALWFGARQIVQPLQALEASASELVWGDFDEITHSVGGIDEIVRLQTTLIHLAEKIQRSQAGLHSYIGAITAGQEEERGRLARELHDETIQALIALNQRVQLTQLKVAADPEAVSALDEIQSLTEAAIQDLRRLIRAMRPLYLEDLGITAALDMLVREISSAENIALDFQHQGIDKRLSPETELALYRIAQEGLSNIIRHAKADNASLILDFSPAETTLTIRDDGCGFEVPESPAEFAPGGHYGLLGMYERSEIIGAQMRIDSTAGEGTLLTILLPS
jgi:signal transduction histidine kinase